MHLSQSSEKALTAVMAAGRRPGLQPVLTSQTIPQVSMRNFTWGSRHNWNNKFTDMDRKALADKIKNATPRYAYFDQKLYARRFRATRAWRASSDWKNPTSDDSNKDKDKDRGSPSSANLGGINSEDWLSNWQLQRMQNFEAFKKKIDKDPYMAIFGGSDKLLRWATNKIENAAAQLEEDIEASNFSKMDAEKDVKNEKVKKSMNDAKNSPIFKTKEEASPYAGPEFNKSFQYVEEKAYDIDPITLRKVERKDDKVFSSKESTPKATLKESETFDIPVKKFQPSFSSKNSMLSKGHGYSQADEWLAREGFRTPTNPTAIKSDLPKSKIESSLDRHLKETSPSNVQKSGVTPTPETQMNDRGVDQSWNANIKGGVSSRDDLASALENMKKRQAENHSENLRRMMTTDSKSDRSDPKESASHSKTSEDDVAAASRRVSEALEAINKHYVPENSNLNVAGTANGNAEVKIPSPEDVKAEKLSRFGNENTRRIQSLLVPLKMQINLVTADYETLRRKWLETTRLLREREAKKVAMQSQLLHQEIEAQKVAMKAVEEPHREDKSGKDVFEKASKGVETSNSAKLNKGASNPLTTTAISAEHHGEGDLSANVGDFASRDRYYKRKAPHANCEMEAKTQKIAKELTLAGELRSIYEETYGKIDSNHRQPILHHHRGEGDMDPSVVNLAYKGRWYKQPASFSKPSTPPTATASQPIAKKAEEAPTGAEGDLCPNVVNLAYPNRWYKRHAPFHTDKSSYTLLKEDPSPTLVSDTPTATADLQAQLAAQARELARLRAALHSSPAVSKPETVTRTEPVFSGHRRGGVTRGERRRAAKGRRRATLKHVVWTGGVTAGVCYAVGVVAEWAGGSGGL